MRPMTQKTFIQRLKLTDFRNYTQAGLVLTAACGAGGKNGAGKTNFMEAISLLSPGRGLRRAVLSDMPRIGAEASFTIFASIDGMNGEADIGTGTETTEEDNLVRAAQDQRLTGKIRRRSHRTPAYPLADAGDGRAVHRTIGRAATVSRPAGAVAGPGAWTAANDFERAMRSRNRLLSEGRFDPSWLSASNSRWQHSGLRWRRRGARCWGSCRTDRGRSADFALSLRPAFPDRFLDELGDLPAFELEERYIEVLAQSRHRDAAAGRTLEGPHRADLTVRHIEKNMDAERCSTANRRRC